MECVANLLASRPMPRTHLDTRRAYRRVDKAGPNFGFLGTGIRQLSDWSREGSCRGPLASAQLARSERVYRSFAAECGLGPWHSRSAPHHRQERDEIATTRFTINREIKHCQVTRALLQMRLGTDRPDVAGS